MRSKVHRGAGTVVAAAAGALSMVLAASGGAQTPPQGKRPASPAASAAPARPSASPVRSAAPPRTAAPTSAPATSGAPASAKPTSAESSDAAPSPGWSTIRQFAVEPASPRTNPNPGSAHVAAPAEVEAPASSRPTATKAGTAKTTFLDVVALLDEHGLRCTGVVVAPRWVLTARHCVPVTSAVFGVSIKSPTATRTITASKVPSDRKMDVALVQLDSAAPVKARPRRKDVDSSDPAGSLRAVGFGANEPSGKRGAGTQRQVDIPVTGWGCDSRRASTTGCVPAFEMVLGRRGTGDTCNGDSGGPAFESVEGGYRLVAITSRAVRNAAQACGDGGISTRVDRISGWMDTVIGRSQ